MWKPILILMTRLCQMVIHAQYVEIGNRRHLESILALQDTTHTKKNKKHGLTQITSSHAPGSCGEHQWPPKWFKAERQ